MEWIDTVITELGGGPLAIIIIGLAVAVGVLWRRLTVVQDAWRADQKEHSSQLVDVIKATENLAKAWENRK